jgi:hypothetical protein
MTSVTNSRATPPPAASPTGAPAVPPPRARLRRASRAPVQGSPEGLPLRRRWGRFAMGAVLALLGAWIFASLYISAGERVEVLAVARDVNRFEEIERDDLRSVRVAAEPGVDTIRAGRADELVGRMAATGLREGSLLAPSQLVPEGNDPVGDREVVVPVELPQSAAPDSAWEPGTEVLVVVPPPDAGTGGEVEPERYEGWLYRVGEVDDQARTRHVELVVPDFAVEEVATAAHEERIVLTMVGGG